MSAKLYIVGTPIGNLGDFSPRAVETLKAVDFIAAEDTRVTLKLLNKFGIDTPMISYHEHNKASRHEEIAARIAAGESGALVTDAGMPAISDPGEDLVRFCHEKGIAVESVPGPSALITALAISGMPSQRFSFEGFLPVAKAERKERLAAVKQYEGTLIFYEAPHKLKNTLADMQSVLGDREIALVRELTKLHETVERTTLSAAVEIYLEKEPKGEYVLIVGGAEKQAATEYTLDQAVELAKKYLQEGMGASNAAKASATETGFKKGDIYKELIK